MCGYRRKWHGVGRAVMVPVLLAGQVGAGGLLATSCAFLDLSWQLAERSQDPHSNCCSYPGAVAERCREQLWSSGGLLWVGLCCTHCPARVCVLGTEQAVCRDGQQRGDTCVGSGLLPRGDRRWMLWEAQTGLCGLLEGAKQHLEGWQSSDSRHTFLRPELKSPARSESIQ